MYQALVRSLFWPLAGMEMSGSGANHSGELSSSMHVNAFPDPDLTDQFDLTVRRSSNTLDCPPVALADFRSDRSSHRISIILRLRQHGPDRASHLVGERDCRKHPRFACQHAMEPRSGGPFRQAARTTAMAPMINSRLMSRWPIFEVFPRICLPPVECWRGTSPSHAAKSRPRLNTPIGGAKVSIAMAVIGPTPGIVCNRRVIAPRLAS
jgi:hypothetical protein